MARMVSLLPVLQLICLLLVRPIAVRQALAFCSGRRLSPYSKVLYDQESPARK